MAPEPERADFWQTLLSRSKLEHKTPSTIAAWKAKFETLETPITLLIGTTYQEGAYLHTELLYYLQALEILHREVSGVDDCTLVERLEALYDLYPMSVKKLFPDKTKDMALLRDARNYLTHYSSKKKFDLTFLESGQLYVLSRKARFFLEISIIGALGFADADIKTLMGKFEPYADVCAFKH